MSGPGSERGDVRRAHVVRVPDRAAYALGAARSEVVLGGERTGGSLAVLEEWLPHGPGPALHRHPEDETYLLSEGTMTFWAVDPELAPADGGSWSPALVAAGVRATPGTVVHVPGGLAHSWRVESPTARILVLSVPAGLDRNVADVGTAVPARASDGAASPATPPTNAPTRAAAPRERPRSQRAERLGDPPPTG